MRTKLHPFPADNRLTLVTDPDHLHSSRYAPDLPTVDAERMEMLRELCSDAGIDTLHEMFGSWETEAARNLAKAHAALADTDQATIKVAAHAIKGSCGNMGIVRLAELGRLLEEHRESLAIAAELLTEMSTEFERARTQLKAITAQA